MKNRSAIPLLPLMAAVIMIIPALFWPAAGSAASHRTYVVAPGGSDAVSCAANTSSNPFATIQKALGCTVDGDIINLAPTGTQPYPGIGAVSSNVIIQAQHGANARTVLIDAGKDELSIAPASTSHSQAST